MPSEVLNSLWLVNSDTKCSNDGTMLTCTMVNREKARIHCISETRGTFINFSQVSKEVTVDWSSLCLLFTVQIKWQTKESNYKFHFIIELVHKIWYQHSYCKFFKTIWTEHSLAALKENSCTCVDKTIVPLTRKAEDKEVTSHGWLNKAFNRTWHSMSQLERLWNTFQAD